MKSVKKGAKRVTASTNILFQPKKVFFSLLLGFVGFSGAFFSFQFDISPLTVSLVWSYCFPLIAALAYGRWYGFITGFFGLGALFPIILWPSNGWAYLVTVGLLLLWFIWHGYCSDQRSIQKKPWNHPLVAQIPYAIFYGFVTYLLYPPALALNPPFWQEAAVTSISQELLLSLIITSTIMMFMNLIVADTILMVSSVRRVLGLEVKEKSRKNGTIIFSSVCVAFIIWITFVMYIKILIVMKFPYDILDLSDPYSLLSFLILIPSGFLVGGILARYIETRYEIEDKLRQSEERFHSLYEHMAEGVALHTLIYNESNIPVDYQILDVNASYETIFHVKRIDIIGKRGTVVFHTQDPPFLSMYVKTTLTKESSIFEAYLDKVDKTFLISVSPVGNEGFAAIFNDITERKNYEKALIESEEKCRTLVEHAPEAIVVIDLDLNRFVDANKQAEHLFLCSRDELLHSAPERFYRMNQEDNSTKRSCAQMMAMRYHQVQDTDSGVFEQTIINSAGEEILCEERLVKLPGTTGNLLRSSLTDISERVRVLRGLAQATKKLNLLSMITCTDIQNSIFGLYAYIELEQDYITDEFLKSLVQKQIVLINKTQKILNFSKNYQDLGLKPPLWQNVNHVFLYAISHLDISYLKRKIHINNLLLFADPLLEKILYSLIENIVIHAPDATEMAFEYQILSDRLLLILTDNGPGVPEDKKERIFERSLEIKGGMSLFLAREMLSITGITIIENGIYGKGARFEVSVPKGGYKFTEDNAS